MSNLVRLLLFSFLLCGSAFAYNDINPDKKNILILHSYNPGNRWTDDITRGMFSIIKPYGFKYNIHMEYMDTKRVTQDMEGYIEAFNTYLQNKFTGTKMDIILISGNNALSFIQQYRQELFPDVPVVFCGVNNYTPALTEGLEPFTGVTEEIDIEPNLQLISHMMPNLKKLFIVNDETTTGRNIHQQIKEIFAQNKYPFEHEYISHMSLDSMGDYMHLTEDNSAILFILFFQDYKRHTYNYNEAVDYLSKKVNVPVFGVWDFYLNNGIIGGLLASGFEQGKRAAALAARILEGEAIQNIPVEKESPNKYLFDYTHLSKFGFSESLLPEGSTIINKPDSLMDTYKDNKIMFLLITAAFVILFLTIAILVYKLKQKKKTQELLAQSKESLEEIVKDRTQELERTNQALEENVQHLVETVQELERKEERLMENEKMANLGELVAGMTHEVNTPLGIAATAISHLDEENKKILEAFTTGQMKKSSLGSFLDSCTQAVQIITSNITRAADLIKSFKSVAVDQCSEAIREFNMHEYLEEILLSLHPKLKKTQHNVELNCPLGLSIENYPGAFSQIITNFIVNSLLHGFDGIEKGLITLTVSEEDDTKIKIIYTDNGKGIDEETLSHIYDRYFTTKKGQGGSGLGLYIIKSIVEKDMKGTIECESTVDVGTTFTIHIPKKIDAA